MENIDATVITTSLPALARDFGQTAIALKVGLTAYIVSLGIFIPVSGWLADRFGSRRIFTLAIVVFSAGSLMCAASTSLALFIAARFVQGVGGALMVPVGRIVIFRTIPKSEFVRAVSYLTIPSLLGPVIGPPLGGFITTFFHWRWIFVINLPIACMGLFLVKRYMPDLREAEPRRLDIFGLALTAIGASLLMLGTSLFETPFISTAWAWIMTLMGALILATYVLYALHTPWPLLELRFLKIPTYRASVLGGSFFRIALGCIPFLLPLALQVGIGLNPFESGLVTCCSAFGSLVMKSLARRVLRRFGFRNVLVSNAVIVAVMITAYGMFTPSTPIWIMALIVLVGGVFPSLQFTSINSIAYADLDSTEVARATSLASTVQQISLGMGITIAGVVLQAVAGMAGHAGIRYTDFQPTFAFMALFSLGSIAFSFRLTREAGAALSAGSQKPVQSTP